MCVCVYRNSEDEDDDDDDDVSRDKRVAVMVGKEETQVNPFSLQILLGGPCWSFV